MSGACIFMQPQAVCVSETDVKGSKVVFNFVWVTFSVLFLIILEFVSVDLV